MDPFIGELRILPYTYAPDQWLWCEGQLLPIAQFNSLYAVIGFQFGGDGRTNFALPNLNLRTALGAGTSFRYGDFPQGQAGGVAGVVLTKDQIPAHKHVVSFSNEGGGEVAPVPNGNVGSIRRGASLFVAEAGSTLTPMAPDQLAMTGADQAHDNTQPYLTLGYAIAYDGVFPTRS